MVDPEEGRPGEGPTGTPADESEPTGEPAPGPETKPEAKPAAKPDEGEDGGKQASPPPEEVPLDHLLERDDVKRAVQSAADRAYARAQKRFEDDAARQRQLAEAQAEDEERRKLLEEGDYDTYGRREAAKVETQERLMESLRQAGSVISQVTTERYAQVLGEDTVNQIVADVEAKRGNIVDLNTALAEAERKLAVDKAVNSTSKAVQESVMKEVEARLAEAGVQRRSADAETRGSEKVSGAKPAAAKVEEETTYEKASQLYGDGEMSWSEFKVYKDEHDKERAR